MTSRRRRRSRRVTRTSKAPARTSKAAARATKTVTRAPKAASVPVARPPIPSPPPPSPAETLLLALARAVSARAGALAQPDIAAMVEMLAAAYAPGAPLAEALREPAAEKTAQLARGWAREQVRQALLDIVASGSTAQVMRTDTDADTLAWLWLAACESLAQETPTAVADRMHALTAFLTARER